MEAQTAQIELLEAGAAAEAESDTAALSEEVARLQEELARRADEGKEQARALPLAPRCGCFPDPSGCCTCALSLFPQPTA